MNAEIHLLRTGARRRFHSERGSSLFLLLILSVVMATVLGGIFAYIHTNAQAERRSDIRIESTYAAEYAFELAYQQLKTVIFQNTVNRPTVDNTSASTNLTTAPTSVFGSANGYTWKAFITVPVDNGVPVASHAITASTTGDFKYMTIVEFERTVGDGSAPVHLQFQREWNYSITPLFQYAVFYNDDLELFPGATFNVTGRVHSNGMIYTGTNASLTYNDYVTDVNGLSDNYSPSDPRAHTTLTGTVTYVKGPAIVTSAKNPPGQMGSDTSDTNTNNDGPRELIEIPNNWQTDPNSSERMYNKAGLKVLVNSTTSNATADSGVAVPANSRVYMTADGTVIPSTDPLATYLGTLLSTGTFSEYRENATFTTTNVDVSNVTTAYNAGGLPQTIPNTTSWPNNATVPSSLKNQAIPSSLRGKSLWNGILYVADITNSSSHRTGIKLINGTKLPDGSNSSSPAAGLTVVSENPTIIVGDYNTGGVPPVDTSSSLTADNHTSSYTVQPAAVMADAVTVVSSNWTSGGYDSKSSSSSRPATNTTINSAIISGIVHSGPTSYSGGVENFIRLLENWGGKRLTYYGSMVNVFESKQSTAKWDGNYYSAANRNWYFDMNFLDPNKLPPGTPVLRTLNRGQWAQIDGRQIF